MEQFLLTNVRRYQSLVRALKPCSKTSQELVDTASNPEITVTARVRPLLEDESTSGIVEGVFQRDGRTSVIDVHELYNAPRGGPKLKSASFRVDQSFGPSDSTEDVFQAVVHPLVPLAWGGGVSVMFAYGQTGSGKTYTVSGLEEMVAETFFHGELDGERKLFVSIIELAGNSASDLLNSRKPISILEDSFGTTQLAGAQEHHVTSKATLLSLVQSAASFRRTASTEKNAASSRSHAICRIRVENATLPSAEDGLLYLVDLAGSEAARDIANHGAERMRETREINISLSVLKDCIRGRGAAAAAGDLGVRRGGKALPQHVPFRQSALTRVLKPVFDPASGRRGCRAVVVACVNPGFLDVGASKNTLRFAEMLRVPGPKVTQLEYDPAVPMSWNNEQAREWIVRNSGTPPVSAAAVAPFESGMQLLRLPTPEFVSRCLKTTGVSVEYASALGSKLWQLHVDSQRRPVATEKKHGERPASGQSGPPHMDKLSSSRDPNPDTAQVLFKLRIRPGMIVRWNPPAETRMSAHGMNMAAVLCPSSAVGSHVKDLQGQDVNPDPQRKDSDEDNRYLCAVVSPNVLPGSYAINLWAQVVVNVSDMEAEVILEYDAATRNYFIAV